MSIVRSPTTDVGFALNQAFSSYIFKDFQTRLFVPNALSAIALLALTSEIQSLLLGEVMTTYANNGYNLENASTFINKIVTEVINAPFLILGVTNESFSNEHVIPTTKGLGSVGEIIHLLGSRNEQITLSFTTNKYPSIFGGFLRKIISKILREAHIVYIIDEMTGYIPCIMKNYKLNKSGKMIGAISGTFSFINLEKQESNLRSVVSHQLSLMRNSAILSGVKYAIPVTAWLVGMKKGLEAKEALDKQLDSLGRYGIGG